jgi:hypothetical protein
VLVIERSHPSIAWLSCRLLARASPPGMTKYPRMRLELKAKTATSPHARSCWLVVNGVARSLPRSALVRRLQRTHARSAFPDPAGRAPSQRRSQFGRRRQCCHRIRIIVASRSPRRLALAALIRALAGRESSRSKAAFGRRAGTTLTIGKFLVARSTCVAKSPINPRCEGNRSRNPIQRTNGGQRGNST